MALLFASEMLVHFTEAINVLFRLKARNRRVGHYTYASET